MNKGVIAIVGPSDYPSTSLIENLTNKYQIPFLSYSNDGINKYLKQINNNKQKNFYLVPDIKNAFIELLKLNKWSQFYYVYNHEKGIKL